jgi:hypothetical protein
MITILDRLSEYAQRFAKMFPSSVPSLLALLSSLSETPQAFRALVPSPDHRLLFTSVLIWLLQNDLLVLLHVRIRIFASEKIKARVLEIRRKHVAERRAKVERSEAVTHTERKNVDYATSQDPFNFGTNQAFSPTTARSTRQSHQEISGDRRRTDSDPALDDDSEDEGGDFDESDLDDPAVAEESIICDPSRATRVERMWLEAMKEGKDSFIRKMFEKSVCRLHTIRVLANVFQDVHLF